MNADGLAPYLENIMRVVLCPLPTAQDDLIFLPRHGSFAGLRCQDELVGKAVVSHVQHVWSDKAVGIPVNRHSADVLGSLFVTINLGENRKKKGYTLFFYEGRE